ncbi:MAG: hypothetical protein V1787_01195 [Candidatus Micrarchaeota archaeon]
MEYTSIQIQPKTRKRLAGFKGFRRESYDEVLNLLMDLIPEGDEEGKYTAEFKSGILRGMLDIRQGRTYSNEEVHRLLGLK